AGEMGQSMESALPDSSRADYQPRFFKPDEFETVEILTEMIIPTDDKPGAREARVANYIDFITFSAAEFKPELQRQWSDGLRALDGLSRQKYTQPFREISPAQREELLTEMSLPEREPNTEHAGYSFYRLVKEMTVEGFYSSRVGLMDVLEYKGLAFLSSFPGCTHPEHH
ncbi:MAG: gluconate 2-dehydrogenase subunit 3 family protein, partial [Terriglobia bacterium]